MSRMSVSKLTVIAYKIYKNEEELERKAKQSEI